MSRGSIINPLLTLDYMQTENENKFFDRKSGKIRPADLAQHIYAASGQFIMVRMFDDRLEIESPGRFPDIVTADNITHTRFSRNKTISRVMTEFEWVREVNEGVKKIYSDMAEAGLPAPEFI